MNFSALASVYSGEKPEYLDQALESLYKQTLQADEIVIVHDGPLTKGLYSCLEKWRSYLPLKEIKLRQQRSLGPALNVGIKECFHELIARFDTDDINHPKRFEMQIKHLEKNPKRVSLALGRNILQKIRKIAIKYTLCRYIIKILKNMPFIAVHQSITPVLYFEKKTSYP